MIVILIGYNYNDKSIPGVGLDLFRAYNYFKTITNNIVIISDKEYINLPQSIEDQINNNEVSSEILEFSSDNTLIVASDRVTLRQKICSIIRRDKRVILYYSGHGSKGGILLPSEEEIPEIELRLLLIDNSNVEELFLIFDCCNGGNMYLPYKLENRFRLGNQYGNHFTDKKVLLISSSSEDEKALSSYKGSLFTYSFFSDLHNGSSIKYLPLLIGRVENEMKAKGRDLNVIPSRIKVYSSHPILPILPSWITNRYVEVSLEDNLLIINDIK